MEVDKKLVNKAEKSRGKTAKQQPSWSWTRFNKKDLRLEQSEITGLTEAADLLLQHRQIAVSLSLHKYSNLKHIDVQSKHPEGGGGRANELLCDHHR